MELRELFKSFGETEKLNSRIGKTIENHQKKTLHERKLIEKIKLEMSKYIVSNPNAYAINMFLHIEELERNGEI